VSTVSDSPTRRAPLPNNRGRRTQAAAAHWHAYKHRPAEMISVSQLPMVNDEFAQYLAETCSISTSFITEMVRRAQTDSYYARDDAQLIAVAMLNQFCYLQLAGAASRQDDEPDDEACIATLTNIF
jgi:hypothetical protein